MSQTIEDRLRRLALAGAFAWSITLFVRLADAAETEMIERILLLGIFVIVPLGLSLIGATDERSHRLLRFVAVLDPFAAVAAFVSLLLQPRLSISILVVPWLVVTMAIASIGFLRMLQMNLRGAAEISVSASLIYLPIGSVWLFAYASGIQPIGFGETIVLLTAVHFHFAGFAAPLLVGLTARRLDRSWNLALAVAVVGVIAGTPLVAAGITASPLIALLGAAVMTIGLLALSILTIKDVIPGIPSSIARLLLLISSLAVLPAMALACTYAYSIVFKKLIIDIPQMAMTHGLANSFGFALCGLTAWVIVDASARRNPNAR
jgi:YndJ-like protein